MVHRLVLAGLVLGVPCPAQAVPEALRPPADQVLAFTLRGTGFQVYEGRAAKEDPSRLEWAFVAPEAELSDARGAKAGTHYAGPTWEGLDGSKVVGEVKVKDTSRSAGSIPWLLLTARTASGEGRFGRIKSIQRLDTSGGAAPADGPARAGQTIKVPYRATYAFFQ